MSNFKANNPKTKEEKLILELINEYHKTTNKFIEKNFDPNENITNELFVILKDATLNHAAILVRDLIDVLYKSHHKKLIEECKKIFCSQIDQLVTKL